MDTTPLSPSMERMERKRLTEPQIDKLKTALGAALRKNNPYVDEAQQIIEDHWDEVYDEVVAANVAVIQRKLDRIRGTITIEVKQEDLVYNLGDGYVQAEDFVAGEIGTFSLNGEEFLVGDEPYVGGEVMVKRANGSGAISALAQAQALVREQDKIPVEYRGKVWFVFTGAIKRESRPRRGRGVAVVARDGARWVLHWFWLGLDFSRRCRVVRARKLVLGS